MAKKNSLQIGVGAICSVLTKFLCPKKEVRTFYQNYTSRCKVTDLIVIGREVKKVSKKKQMCILFRHNSFENFTLYCVKCWVQVISEGDPSQFFNVPREVPASEEETNDGSLEEQDRAIDNRMLACSSNHEDIQHMRSLGLDVDDDNDPAPENIPDHEPLAETNQTWGWNGLDYRALKNGTNVRPVLCHGLNEIPADPCRRTLLSLFMTLFPMEYLEEHILKATNKNLDPGVTEISLGELLRFFGIWFFLATTAGFPRRDYFSKTPVNFLNGAPYRVNMWMTRNRFDTILKALAFTTASPPSFKDRFWQVRDMIAAWNKNMDKVFRSGWITCLDESMSTWVNKYTCPGWMFVPRKPRPFGNEYHSICCGLSCIMFAIQLVEGKDRPKELPSPPKKKKTENLLLELTKSIWTQGKIVVLDSGFCVLTALIALQKAGVFAHAVIKKRRFWPKYVPGDAIEDRMKEKEVGAVDSLKGEIDGVPYNIFCMKEPDYVMKLMSTYGALTVDEGEPENVRYVQGEKTTFKYTKNFAYHFKYRHMVDDHNNLRHSTPTLEDTWTTHVWENRVFAFLLAITEVNLYCYLRYTSWRTMDEESYPTLHQFRKKLAMALIENKFIVSDEAEERLTRSSNRTKHVLMACPRHAKKFEHGKWVTTCKLPYQQHRCRSLHCKKMVRTYCL